MTKQEREAWKAKSERYRVNAPGSDPDPDKERARRSHPAYVGLEYTHAEAEDWEAEAASDAVPALPSEVERLERALDLVCAAKPGTEYAEDNARLEREIREAQDGWYRERITVSGLRALLQEVEWRGGIAIWPTCPSCGGMQDPGRDDLRARAAQGGRQVGHAVECRLAAELRGKPIPVVVGTARVEADVVEQPDDTHRVVGTNPITVEWPPLSEAADKIRDLIEKAVSASGVRGVYVFSEERPGETVVTVAIQRKE